MYLSRMTDEGCGWPSVSRLMQQYHDEEWGVPLHDDRKLFEFLVLEGFQAGLSWSTILNKREAFREAFAGFDPEKVAGFNEQDVERLLNDAGIIRNRLKIAATIQNARCFLQVQKEYGSFDRYIWSFVNFQPVINHFTELSEMPAHTQLSDTISADLKKRGFKFVGSTIVYAHMQATGMVNDHVISCRRHYEIKALTAGK
jgi:DNA-3-methyladenine glycosylase I